MKLRKCIAYCYPSSPRSIEAGNAGYYVAHSILREDGSWSPDYMASPDIFESIDDADLIQLLKELDGEYYPKYCQFQNNKGFSPL